MDNNLTLFELAHQAHYTKAVRGGGYCHTGSGGCGCLTMKNNAYTLVALITENIKLAFKDVVVNTRGHHQVNYVEEL